MNARSHWDAAVDEVLRDESPNMRLDEALQHMNWGEEMGRIFKAPRTEQLELLGDLESRARDAVAKYLHESLVADAELNGEPS